MLVTKGHGSAGAERRKQPFQNNFNGQAGSFTVFASTPFTTFYLPSPSQPSSSSIFVCLFVHSALSVRLFAIVSRMYVYRVNDLHTDTIYLDRGNNDGHLVRQGRPILTFKQCYDLMIEFFFLSYSILFLLFGWCFFYVCSSSVYFIFPRFLTKRSSKYFHRIVI